jgi:hypothetical protein
VPYGERRSGRSAKGLHQKFAKKLATDSPTSAILYKIPGDVPGSPPRLEAQGTAAENVIAVFC